MKVRRDGVGRGGGGERFDRRGNKGRAASQQQHPCARNKGFQKSIPFSLTENVFLVLTQIFYLFLFLLQEQYLHLVAIYLSENLMFRVRKKNGKNSCRKKRHPLSLWQGYLCSYKKTFL